MTESKNIENQKPKTPKISPLVIYIHIISGISGKIIDQLLTLKSITVLSSNKNM